jgi:hypothetical protein
VSKRIDDLVKAIAPVLEWSYGNAVPDFDFTNEISALLSEPSTVRSKKWVIIVASSIIANLPRSEVRGSSVHVVTKEINRRVRQVNSGTNYVRNPNLSLVRGTGGCRCERDVGITRWEDRRRSPVGNEKDACIGGNAANAVEASINGQRI